MSNNFKHLTADTYKRVGSFFNLIFDISINNSITCDYNLSFDIEND